MNKRNALFAVYLNVAVNVNPYFLAIHNLVGEILKLLLTFYLCLDLSKFIIFAPLWICFC